MKKQILTLVAALAAFFSGHAAQDVIARVHNGATIFHYINPPYTYQTLQNVLDGSLDGDTLYLPGVQFDFTTSLGSADVLLSKRLVLIGTGVFADSAIAAGDATTRFWANGPNFRIVTGASNSQIHGINFMNMDVFIGQNASNQNVSGLKFSRCYFGNNLCLGYGNVNNNSGANTATIENCIVKYGINICKIPTVLIKGCVLRNIVQGIQSTVCENNLFVSHVNDNSNNDVRYTDNIFLWNVTTTTTINQPSRYYNNLFVTNNTGTILQGTATIFPSSNISVGNINNVFVSPPSTNPLTEFSYYADYHLKAGSPYLTMSSTAGPVGQYAGNPNAYWKDGLLPFNPHWRELQVPANTNNGLLNIVIKASAQQY